MCEPNFIYKIEGGEMLNIIDKKIFGVVGDLVSVEATFALKKLIEGLGGSVECRLDQKYTKMLQIHDQ